MPEQDKAGRAEVLASRIMLLFTMVYDLREFKDLLEEVSSTYESRASLAVSMAPIFGAVGEDYEQVEMEQTLYAKRAKAILNLITTIDETEETRRKFIDAKAAKQKGRDQLRQIFGGSL